MPVRESRDQHSFDNSPELFAVFHALQSLLTPRHPPCALSSLTTLIPSSLQLDHQVHSFLSEGTPPAANLQEEQFQQEATHALVFEFSRENHPESFARKTRATACVTILSFVVYSAAASRSPTDALRASVSINPLHQRHR
jgi:hypothetical protein